MGQYFLSATLELAYSQNVFLLMCSNSFLFLWIYKVWLQVPQAQQKLTSPWMSLSISLGNSHPTRSLKRNGQRTLKNTRQKLTLRMRST